jgi:DNA-binding transcriptional MerR regulator
MTDERSRQLKKSETAFRTIGEVAAELGIAQHVLRYWEGRFPQLKPLQRAGNRRLYRPADVDLARRIHTLLNSDGYSIRGAQTLIAKTVPVPTTSLPGGSDGRVIAASQLVTELQTIRDMLLEALAEDGE